MTTRDAIYEFKFQKEKKAYCGSADPEKAGNGSLMRLAPVPLFYWTDHKKAIHNSGLSSKTTHQAHECIGACEYYGGLIWGAVDEIPKEELLSPLYGPYNYWKTGYTNLHSKILEIANGSFKEKRPPDICAWGRVSSSMEAALWAFYNSNSFEEGCILAVNLGDDADTVGAIYGMLAGAYYGIDNIPERWTSKLIKLELLNEYATKLYNKSLEIEQCKTYPEKEKNIHEKMEQNVG